MSGEVKWQGWGSAGPVRFTSPEGSWAIICMHMHGMNGISMPERTSIGRPPRTAERMETVAASAAAASRTTAVEPLRLATVAAHTEPPARLGVGSKGVHGCPMAAVGSALRRRYSSLYACGDAISGCTWARDGVHTMPERHGGGWSELVMDSKRRDACTCTACGHVHCTSAPQSGRLGGPRRGSWRRQRPWQQPLGLQPWCHCRR
jgi:hypothetical protein